MFARATTSLFSRSLAAAAASAILFSASVQASPVTAVEKDGRIYRSVEVQFVDLDLTTAEGVAALESRLKGASRKVCGTPQRGSLDQYMDHRACLTEVAESSQRAMVTLVARAEAGENFKPGDRIAVGS